MLTHGWVLVEGADGGVRGERGLGGIVRLLSGCGILEGILILSNQAGNQPSFQ